MDVKVTEALDRQPRLEDSAEEAMDIRDTPAGKMRELTAESSRN